VLLVSAISVCFDFDMSAKGQSRRSGRGATTSGLPQQTDIRGVRWHVSKLPSTDMQQKEYRLCFCQ
jgi:hypothetical protein